MKRIPFEDLQFTDHFMFEKVLMDEEICRELLERLLKIKVSMQDIANIYHINKESVSRRKQRIKSKIGNDLLQGLTLDEFIQRF